MKRRDFMKASALGALALGQGCSSAKLGSRKLERPENTGPGFDVHPFVKNNPNAVFICLTDVDKTTNDQAMKSWGEKLSKELIVKVQNGGWPLPTKVTLKPNWTCAQPQDGKPVVEKLGVCTDPYFVEGWALGMRESGPQNYFIREGSCTSQWEPMGYAAMAERASIDLRSLPRGVDLWDMEDGKDVIWRNVPDGVMLKKIGYIAPMNEPGTFLVNIAKFKAHGMGITAAVKNLQGMGAGRFRNMCTPLESIKKGYGEYLRYFHKDFDERVNALYKQHLDAGYPRWARPEPPNRNGLCMETWCQRELDSYSVSPTALNIVEGIYSQDGNGLASVRTPKSGRTV